MELADDARLVQPGEITPFGGVQTRLVDVHADDVRILRARLQSLGNDVVVADAASQIKVVRILALDLRRDHLEVFLAKSQGEVAQVALAGAAEGRRRARQRRDRKAGRKIRPAGKRRSPRRVQGLDGRILGLKHLDEDLLGRRNRLGKPEDGLRERVVAERPVAGETDFVVDIVADEIGVVDDGGNGLQQGGVEGERVIRVPGSGATVPWPEPLGIWSKIPVTTTLTE